jgi:hypothetical protein
LNLFGEPRKTDRDAAAANSGFCGFPRNEDYAISAA